MHINTLKILKQLNF